MYFFSGGIPNIQSQGCEGRLIDFEDSGTLKYPASAAWGLCKCFCETDFCTENSSIPHFPGAVSERLEIFTISNQYFCAMKNRSIDTHPFVDHSGKRFFFYIVF